MLRRRYVVSGVMIGAVVALGFFFRDNIFGHLHAGALTSKEVAPGVELKEADLFRGGSKSGRLYALFIEPSAAEPSIVINDGGSAMANVAPDAIAVVNAGFFTPEFRATGLLISQGKMLSPFIAEGGGAGSGVFVLDDGKPSLVLRETAKREQFERAELALQAGPRIIEPDGSPGIRGDDGQRANRTAIGADKQGRVVVAVAVGPSGWSTGPTLFELQRLLARDLGLSFALNLDGGPSTGLFVRGEENVAIAESAPIHSALAWRKKP